MQEFGLTLGTEQIFIRIILSLLIGGVIGYERGCNNRPAGFRTHILVCLGASIVSLLQDSLRVNIIKFILDNPDMKDHFKTDLGRIGAQVVSGIGFLGAGTIMKERGTIEGLTTAASLWATGCIGLAIGWGFYTISIVSGFAVIVVLVTLKQVELSLIYKKHYLKLEIEFYEDSDYNQNIIFVYDFFLSFNENMRIKNIDKIYNQNKIIYTLVVPKQFNTLDMISKLSKNDFIKKVTTP